MSSNIEKCLRDFIHHVDRLQSEDDPAGTGFHREFRILREVQVQSKREETHLTENGQTEENIKKNRYKDILPRDDIRVRLSVTDGEEESDYINATFIKDIDGQNGYIAAQGPMPNTVSDFWRMLWDYKIEIVFMACRLNEGGKPKCEKYWADVRNTETFGHIVVTTLEEENILEDFVLRKLQAVKNGQAHTLMQFHYMGWPDHGTPSSPKVLRKMIEVVRNSRKQVKIPMVIHCSAGCGRTGTICAIDYAWTLLEKGLIDNGFSIFEIIKSLREQRLSMVQTPDQYEYTHMVLKTLCEEWLADFADHDYENIVIGDKEEQTEKNYYNVNVSNVDTICEEGTQMYCDVDPKGNCPLKISNLLKETSMPNKSEMKLKTGQLDLAVNVINSTADANFPASTQEYRRDEVKTFSIGTGPTPQSAHLPQNQITDDDVGGVYVEVQHTTQVNGWKISSPPPTLPEKKKASLNKDELQQPFKTVISITGDTSEPIIKKTGSVGFSSTRIQVPKTMASVAVSQQGRAVPRCSQETEQVQQQPLKNHSQDVSVYSDVMKQSKPKTQDQPDFSHSIMSSCQEEVPAVPDRCYTSEEITGVGRLQPNNYDNVWLAQKDVSTMQQSPAQKDISTMQQSSAQKEVSILSGPVIVSAIRSKLRPNNSDSLIPIGPSSPAQVKKSWSSAVDLPGRPQRVRGPRPMPAKWNTQYRIMKSTYL